MNKKISFSILFFLSLSCFAQKANFYEENSNVNLFAFIGKKISVQEFDPNAGKKEIVETDSITGEQFVRKSITMDNAFKCKYVVIEKIFNDLKNDTVEFIAYDHYGRPGFDNYENVILYISKTKDGKGYFHQKYQYDPLFKKKGKTFGYFDFRMEEDFAINSKLETFKIDLGETGAIDVTSYNEYMRKTYVPEPFYKIKNNVAKPVLGASVKTLFVSKRLTRFKDLFQN
ncbi:hypothetical protein [Flavobacterium sp.]|uniref:hypothetical protein n=1 Tax=Flavobacterium sp. TaxID=239 RepID=UPI0039E47A9A